MIRRFLTRLRRQRDGEDGSAAVEFVLVFPVMVTLILMTLELGFITLRQSLLDRGLDMAVREVRLGTGSAPQHDAIKDLVCQNALFLRNCDTQLRLEMIPSNPRAFVTFDDDADCTDHSEPARPVRNFVPGQQNQLVLMRACVKYDPLFPDALLSRVLAKDDSGQPAIIAMTAFVQEPL